VLPITLEVPSEPVSLSIVRQCWREIGSAYPGERGAAQSEPSDLPGLSRVTLNVPSRQPVYEHLLAALTHIDALARMRRAFPPLYEGHVHYEAEPIGKEEWLSTPALFARGAGDCEDLAADLAASYQLAGIDARPMLQLESRSITGDVWHVIVVLPDGRTEDPSRLLGMG
jgi:hypothetical protein